MSDPSQSRLLGLWSHDADFLLCLNFQNKYPYCEIEHKFKQGHIMKIVLSMFITFFRSVAVEVIVEICSACNILFGYQYEGVNKKYSYTQNLKKLFTKMLYLYLIPFSF